MPYDITLHKRNGTFIDGTDLSVPVGYARHFNFRTLNGRRAGSTRAMLAHVIHDLGIETGSGKHKPTRGNVGALLGRMLAWAEANPDGVWHVIGE